MQKGKKISKYLFGSHGVKKKVVYYESNESLHHLSLKHRMNIYSGGVLINKTGPENKLPLMTKCTESALKSWSGLEL